jgi:hypothetical protein
MKRIIFILVAMFVSVGIFAQQKKEACCLSKKDIVGTWQLNDSIVSSGLNQNFQFFENGSFVFNVGGDADDVRNIIQLKGKYRLDKDQIYFTIISKTIVEGNIEISDPGVSLNIFSIAQGKVREVLETNPKELTDPCYITLFTNHHIKINRESYYKVRTN